MSLEFERIDWIKNTLESQLPTSEDEIGPGDDASVWIPPPGESIVISNDSQVEGTHFINEWITPKNLGRRAVEVTASDLAAMGAQPQGLTISLTLPKTYSETAFKELYSGILEASERNDLKIWGGNLTQGPLNLCLTVTGSSGRWNPLRRDGLKEGDDLWVSGNPGFAGMGRELLLQNLQPDSHLETLSIDRFLNPQARIKEILELRTKIQLNSAIDISDGLAKDLQHLLTSTLHSKQSSLSAELQLESLTRLPNNTLDEEELQLSHRALTTSKDLTYWSLEGGEDYEVLFSVSKKESSKLESLTKELSFKLSKIGEVQSATNDTPPQIYICSSNGNIDLYKPSGFDHFYT